MDTSVLKIASIHVQLQSFTWPNQPGIARFEFRHEGM